MSRRTYTWNAYESSLNGAINTSAVSITLNSVTGLRAPGYLVIDPDIPASREFIRYETINASAIEGVTRNVDGAALNSHDDGAKIRAVPVHQFFDDIFTDIEDIESAAAAHTGAANPHSNSAAADDLVATDALVAANTAGVATNVTNLATHTADDESHRIHEFVDAIDIALPTSGAWVSVVSDVIAIPSHWVTYELILRGGGVYRSDIASTGKFRVHSDVTGYAAFGVDGTTFRAQGLYELDTSGGGNVRLPFTIVGKSRLGVITRTADPNPIGRLEGFVDVTDPGTKVDNPWIEMEAIRRS